MVDEASGHEYFWNPGTGESRWLEQAAPAPTQEAGSPPPQRRRRRESHEMKGELEGHEQQDVHDATYPMDQNMDHERSKKNTALEPPTHRVRPPPPGQPPPARSSGLNI